MKKQPTYEELLQENKKLRTENSRKDERIAYLERMLFGSKSDKAPKVDSAQGGLSVAGGCRCLTKDGNTSIEKEGYIPYPLQA